MRGKLIVQEPGQASCEYFIGPGPRVVVGRSDKVDIRISEIQATHQHTAFEARATGIYVIDFRTTNGTFLNGSRIAGPELLKSGDVVTIGQTRITFVGL